MKTLAWLNLQRTGQKVNADKRNCSRIIYKLEFFFSLFFLNKTTIEHNDFHHQVHCLALSVDQNNTFGQHFSHFTIFFSPLVLLMSSHKNYILKAQFVKTVLQINKRQQLSLKCSNLFQSCSLFLQEFLLFPNES